MRSCLPDRLMNVVERQRNASYYVRAKLFVVPWQYLLCSNGVVVKFKEYKGKTYFIGAVGYFDLKKASQPATEHD